MQRVHVGTLDTGFVVFDATMKETHVRDSEITGFPVEQGANVSDHQRPLPNGLRLFGIVSQTPVISSTNIAEQVTRVQQARDLMIKFRDESILVDVFTYRETYSQMLVKTITESVDASNGNDFEAEIVLQQVSTASLQFVQAPTPKKPSGATNKELGAKSPTDATNKSVVTQMLNAAVHGFSKP